jgi:hypothetical protein
MWGECGETIWGDKRGLRASQLLALGESADANTSKIPEKLNQFPSSSHYTSVPVLWGPAMGHEWVGFGFALAYLQQVSEERYGQSRHIVVIALTRGVHWYSPFLRIPPQSHPITFQTPLIRLAKKSAPIMGNVNLVASIPLWDFRHSHHART